MTTITLITILNCNCCNPCNPWLSNTPDGPDPVGRWCRKKCAGHEFTRTEACPSRNSVRFDWSHRVSFSWTRCLEAIPLLGPPGPPPTIPNFFRLRRNPFFSPSATFFFFFLDPLFLYLDQLDPPPPTPSISKKNPIFWPLKNRF